MISFKPAMQSEKIAVIALIIIVVGALSIYLVATNSEDIFGNLFNNTDEIITETGIVIGDSADVDYIGSFKINGTIFDTSNEIVAKENGIYDENRNYEPLKIFVNPNGNLTTPSGYTNYTSSMIPGFLKGLIGMEKGETKTVTIPPEDAYGIWNVSLADEMGMNPYPLDTIMNITQPFDITTLSTYFPDLNITINTTFDYGSLMLGVNNTLNATIANIDDINVTLKLHPENGVTFTQPYFNWNVTFIITNDTSFTVHTDTYIGHIFSFEFYGVHFKVVDLNETSAKFAVNMQAPDIKFVDQTLVFELETINVYKTSQQKT